MANRDIEFGWARFAVDLSNVRLVRTTELQELRDGERWSQRSPLLVGMFATSTEERDAANAEYERAMNLRVQYSRTLSATAHCSDYMECGLFLGVPDGKHAGPSHGATRLQSFNVSVREILPTSVEAQDINRLARQGRIGYIKEDPELGHEEEVYAQFYAGPEFFDQIEHTLLFPGVVLRADINSKCWHCFGPLCGVDIYVAKGRETQSAELATLQVTSHHSMQDRPAEEGGAPESYRPLEAILGDVLNLLRSTSDRISQIKTAALVTALATVVLVFILAG